MTSSRARAATWWPTGWTSPGHDGASKVQKQSSKLRAVRSNGDFEAYWTKPPGPGAWSLPKRSFPLILDRPFHNS